MKKKLISLINNERTNIAIHSAKASDYCTDGAYDHSYTDENHAHCTTYAYDVCGKDYAACYAGADDVCSYTDTTVCYGPGAEDNT
jgi:hypothetical protein